MVFFGNINNFIGIIGLGAILLAGGCQSSAPAPTSTPVPPAQAKAVPVAPVSGKTVTAHVAEAVNDAPVRHDVVLCHHLRRPEKSGFLQPQSFVTSWYIYGPFSYRPHGEASDDDGQIIHHQFLQDERFLGCDPAKSRLIRSPGVNPLGGVDLERATGASGDYSAIYAVACIYTDHEMNNLMLYSGSDDYIKIWINGTLVHTYNHKGRPGKWDQDVIQGIKLRQGLNLVVVKSINLVGSWLFFFRLADQDGSPLEFVPCDRPVNEVSRLVSTLRKE